MNARVTLTCVCVCVPWGGVSLYCPKIQAKGNLRGHTRYPASHNPFRIFSLCQAWEGGAPGRARMSPTVQTDLRAPDEVHLLPSSQEAQASGARGSTHYSTDRDSTAALPPPPCPFAGRAAGEGKTPGIRSNQQIKKHKELGQGRKAGALPATPLNWEEVGQ